MKVPFFKAKDIDSDKWVEGFYVEFPELYQVENSPLTHVIMVVVPDENSLFPDKLGESEMFDDMIHMAENFTVNGEGGYKLAQQNTLVYCTIDINTLEQIGEVEIGKQFINRGDYLN